MNLVGDVWEAGTSPAKRGFCEGGGHKVSHGRKQGKCSCHSPW